MGKALGRQLRKAGLIAVVLASAAALAGCGGGGGGDDSSASTGSTATTTTTTTTPTTTPTDVASVAASTNDQSDVGWFWNGKERFPIVPSTISVGGPWTSSPSTNYLYALVDGNRSTYTGGNGIGVYYTFEVEPYEDTVGQISLNLKTVSIAFGAASTPFAIEVSSDGTNYVSVGTWTSSANYYETDENGRRQYIQQNFDITDNSGTNTKFVRIKATGSSSVWLNIAEVKLWGDVNGQSVAMVHPAFFATSEELTATRTAIASTGRRQRAYNFLVGDVGSEKDYQDNALTYLQMNTRTDSTDTDQGHVEYVEEDSEAILKQAILWEMTRDSVYAENVIRIADAWATKLQSVSGSNAYLELSWGLQNFVRAIDIVKQTYPDWDRDVETRFVLHLDNLMTPVLDNPAVTSDIENRWFTNVEARMTQAIYRNSRYQFNRAVEDFKEGIDAYTRPWGEVGDLAGRDVIHAEFEIGSIVQIAELARTQGVDLYSYADSRIKTILEYHALILNGGTPETLPSYRGVTVWPVVQDESTGELYSATGPTKVALTGWELGYNHYVNRTGQSLPETKKRIDVTRDASIYEILVFCWGFGALFAQ